MLKEELEAKIREFGRQAEKAIEDEALDSAVVLLSKAAFALVDLFYLRDLELCRVSIK